MNSTVNSTIQEAARQQQRLQQQRMHDFCVATFLQNLVFQVALFLLLSVIFKFGLLDQLRLKVWDALRLRQVRIRGALQVYRHALEILVNIGWRSAFQDSFIRKYGLEMFNYLNFLNKVLLAIALFFLYALVSSIWYFFWTEKDFDYFDFWIGNFNFKKHALYVTINAFACGGLMAWVLHRLRTESQDIHGRHLIQGIDDPESQQGVLLRTVFLTVDEPVSEPTHLKTEIARITNSPRNDPFWLVYFPNVHKIWRWRIKLRKLREMQVFKMNPGTWAQRLFGEPIQNPQEYIREKIKEFEAKASGAIKKPIVFTSQGLIIFYKFEDVYRFWKALRAESWKVHSAPELGDQNQLAVVTPVHRFLKHTKTYFLSSYSDLLIGHIHEYRFRYRTVQLLTYLVLAITLIFLTTPIAAVKNFAPLLFGSTVFGDLFQKFLGTIMPMGMLRGYINSKTPDNADRANTDAMFKTELGSFLLYSFFPLVLILINILVSFLIERIGSWQKLPRHSLFHQFVFRLFYVYYMINLFVIPGLLAGSTSSLFEVLLLGDTFGSNRKVWSWRFYKSGSFYSSLIVQSSIVRLFSDLMMIVPLINNGFNYHRMVYRLKHVRKNNGDKQISDVYTYGYNYSMECVMFSLIYIFGLSQPLIFFSGLTYAFIRCFSSAVVLSTFYKKQIYMNTEVYDFALGKLVLAIPLSFFILALKFWAVNKTFYFAIHVAAFLVSSVAVFTRRHRTFTFEDLLHKIANTPDLAARLTTDQPLSEEEKAVFKEHYANKVMDKLARDKYQKHGLI